MVKYTVWLNSDSMAKSQDECKDQMVTLGQNTDSKLQIDEYV